MTRRIVASAVLAALTLSLSVARAGHTPDAFGCPLHLGDTSSENPNLIDGSNDWDGVATGNQTGTIPYADVYREGTDITNAWLHRDAAGKMTAHIETQTLSTLQPNAIFYFLWTYGGSDPTKRTRYVSAKLKGYGVDFFVGYHTTNAAGVGSFVTVGTTTGRLVEGSPGEIVIDVPAGGELDDWGAPAAGSTLGGLRAEARVLLGSPETLPPNPVARSGVVGVADDTDDAIRFCDAYVE